MTNLGDTSLLFEVCIEVFVAVLSGEARQFENDTTRLRAGIRGGVWLSSISSWPRPAKARETIEGQTDEDKSHLRRVELVLADYFDCNFSTGLALDGLVDVRESAVTHLLDQSILLQSLRVSRGQGFSCRAEVRTS